MNEKAEFATRLREYDKTQIRKELKRLKGASIIWSPRGKPYIIFPNGVTERAKECPNCGTYMSSKSGSICGYCQNKESILEKKPESLECVYCNARLEDDALFCKSCGRATKKSRHIPASIRKRISFNFHIL